MSYTAEDFIRREAEIVAAGKLATRPSLAERFAALPRLVRERFLAELSALDALRLLYAWEFWGRAKQWSPPGDWVVWLVLGGRGMGKNRTGAEWVRARIESGNARSIAFVGPDWRDVRRYMVGGKKGAGGSGFLDVMPPWVEVHFIENKAEIHIPYYDAVIYLNTAEQKELRGANLDTIWGDELVKWKYAAALWDNIEMTLRDPGTVPPQMVLTTTPQPMPLLKDIMMDPGTYVTHGTTEENASNVAERWLARMKRRYAGTRFGLQELEARVLGDNPDALFHQPNIEAHRVADHPELVRVAVGIDPAVSTKRKSDEHGIIAAGVDVHGHLYVLGDASGKMSPEGWAVATVDLAVANDADHFVVERNKIGDLAAHTIRQELRRRGLESEYEIREAYSMEDKAARAEPVAALYERGEAHHVGRRLGKLEGELTSWNPRSSRSPNRLDALVHVAFDLCRLADAEPEMDPLKAFRGFEEANRAFAHDHHGDSPIEGFSRGRSI